MLRLLLQKQETCGAEVQFKKLQVPCALDPILETFRSLFRSDQGIQYIDYHTFQKLKRHCKKYSWGLISELMQLSTQIYGLC